MKILTRRSFITKTTTVAAGAILLPGLPRISKNEKLNIAVIGVGGRGRANWNACKNHVAL